MKLLFYSFIILLSYINLYALSNAEEIEIIRQTEKEIQSINKILDNPNNLWLKKYSNYQAYQQVIFNITKLQEEIISLQSQPKTLEIQSQLINLERNLNTLNQQKNLLEIYKDSPFIELIESSNLGEIPNVTNPILIIQAFSYIKRSKQEVEALRTNYKTLEETLDNLRKKEILLNTLLSRFKDPQTQEQLKKICAKDYCLFHNPQSILKALQDNAEIIKVLETTQNIFATTFGIFSKETEENAEKLRGQIKAQTLKGVYIGIALLILIAIAIFTKLGVRKYIHNNERIYTANKIINFLNITLILMILLFSYLDNVSYLVTVLGFASAGLAIAMKDLFMSILGWFVIIIGGAVHAGDRIKVIKDGAVYVGDVLDISVLRIILYEDVTLTSYKENRRAGRVIFIPNNFIFTTMFSNYSHSGMQTVWDGIDFTITFQSDHAKACHIARECARKYAKGYTESTRKQFNKLRNRYTLRNINVEPRVYSFLEPNGIRISVWYLTNSFATLALRSNISAEIINEILKTQEIKIAYPSTTIYSGDKNTPISDGSIPPISIPPTQGDL
ncbi:mechanosensitive ion channel domain-containing protein [Helicobacter mesocricetorum]|uniref:mechanosensitive ion channel domain-containing protein n=1 Tax=Helicobacter mesocricetorum TaxID=87012 RepID=UPI000CF15526|nr:mechanosensitive ion channel domain-containing protein [Helicobacter mesocricetorum]